MRLKSVDRDSAGYVAHLAGRPGETARLTDTSIAGLKASVRRMIEFDRASQQQFLELFARLTASDMDVGQRSSSEQQNSQAVLGA